MKNLTLKQKMFMFATVVCIILILTMIRNITEIDTLEKEFQIFSQKDLKGEIAALTIQADLNYISRCTRDIMLGNSYESNIKKIEEKKSINDQFEILKQSIKDTSNETKELNLVSLSQKSTNDFINYGYNKMLSLKDQTRTSELLSSIYEQYKKDATPLANESRKYFGQIKKTKANGLQIRTLEFENEIKNFRQNLLIASMVLLIVIMGYLLYITKDILNSITNLQNGLNEFFKFLNGEIATAKLIKISSNDEIGQMSRSINENITLIDYKIKADERFLLKVEEMVNHVKMVICIIDFKIKWRMRIWKNYVSLLIICLKRWKQVLRVI